MSNRRVKCRFCDKFTIQKEAYKVSNNGKNEYYCNKEHYDQAVSNKENRAKVLDICDEIFEIKVSKDTFFLKELKVVTETTKLEVLADYLSENMIDLDVALSKDFKTLNFKIRYFFAIVRKNIQAFELEQKADNKVEHYEVEHIKYKFKPRKRKITWTELIGGKNNV